jgi:hypothetical protein
VSRDIIDVTDIIDIVVETGRQNIVENGILP